VLVIIFTILFLPHIYKEHVQDLDYLSLVGKLRELERWISKLDYWINQQEDLIILDLGYNFYPKCFIDSMYNEIIKKPIQPEEILRELKHVKNKDYGLEFSFSISRTKNTKPSPPIYASIYYTLRDVIQLGKRNLFPRNLTKKLLHPSTFAPIIYYRIGKDYMLFYVWVFGGENQ